MKPSTKSISSPGRTENFPPSLVRFHRSNMGSRSRGKSRSSPMFVNKKNAAMETTEEPSSPKVTCMGQVRARQSSKEASTSGSGIATHRTRRKWRWTRPDLFCHDFPGKIKPGSGRNAWGNWALFFQMGSRRKPKLREASSKNESKSEEKLEYSGQEEEEAAADKVFESCSYSPPKNALTRCRSVPYRSSSLASKFWSSPLRNEDTDEEHLTENENREKQTEMEKPESQRDYVSIQEPERSAESDKKIAFFKGIEDSIRESMAKSANTREQLKAGDAEERLRGSLRPLRLTRCKSEPARTAELCL